MNNNAMVVARVRDSYVVRNIFLWNLWYPGGALAKALHRLYHVAAAQVALQYIV